MRRPKFPATGRLPAAMVLFGALAVVVRLIYLYAVFGGSALGLDSVWYGLVGSSIAQGHGFSDPGALFSTGQQIPTAAWPPLYPGLLSLAVRFGPAGINLQIVGCILGALTVVLTGLLARRLAGDRAAYIAAGGACLYPLLISSDAAQMSEALYVPLSLAVLLLALRLQRSETFVETFGARAGQSVALGAVLGLCILTRGSGIVLGCLVVIVLIATSRARLRAAMRLVPAVAVCAVLLLPWSIRNSSSVGTWNIATKTSSTAVAGSNCDAAYNGPDLGRWVFACLPNNSAGKVSEAAWSKTAMKEGLRYATAHPARLATVVVPVRLMRTFGVWFPFEQAQWEADRESRVAWWQRLGWATYLIVAATAVVGAYRLRDDRRVLLLLAVPFAVTIVDAVVAGGNTRYRIVCEPVLVALAAVVLAVGRESRATGATRQAYLAGAPATTSPTSTRRVASTGAERPVFVGEADTAVELRMDRKNPAGRDVGRLHPPVRIHDENAVVDRVDQ